MRILRRHQIKFGKTDAKSSFVSRDNESRELFLDAFAKPNEADIYSIRNGDKYIFYGTKGSGKTALLRYMREIESKDRNVTKVVVFNEDISESDKERIFIGTGIENEAMPIIEEHLEVKDAWKIFLIQKLAALLLESKEFFDDKSDAKYILNLANKVFGSTKSRTFNSILSGITNGSFIFKGKVPELAELETSINWNKPDEIAINVSRFAESFVDKICSISYPDDVKYILYIDELNLSMLGHIKHKKDSILIRDLVISIGHLNRIFTERNIPVYIYVAVRLEIAKLVSMARAEIDKYLVDHGHHLQWHNSYDINSYPIFGIVEKRINAIERRTNKGMSTSKDVWSEYFSKDIYGVSPKRFLSEITWCNPRDIVNIFNLASDVNAAYVGYNTNIFAEIMEKYSDLAWVEREEELNTEHNMTVVQGIKASLTGWYRHFKVDVLSVRMKEIGDSNKVVMQIHNTLGAEKICRDLYYVGVLGQSVLESQYKDGDGNIKRNFRETWFYRDNREFDRNEWMVVHKGLYGTLKLPRLREDDFGNDARIRG